jgi:predicted site-specific integrase-resolvase
MEDRLFNEIKPKFIPLKKVLKILDISRVTADTWHRQGILTKYYKGSRVYYLTKDIDNLLPSSN